MLRKSQPKHKDRCSGVPTGPEPHGERPRDRLPRSLHRGCSPNPATARPCVLPAPLNIPLLYLAVRPTDRLFVAVHCTGRIGDSLSSEAVTDALLRARRAANLPAIGYSAHSLRAGFVTEADRAHATVLEIQQRTGHRTHESVAVHRRRHNASDGNAVIRIGL